MSVEQIVAFRTSNGHVFEGKVEAYQEELVAIYGQIPKVGRRGFSLVELDKLLEEMTLWKERARTVFNRMQEEVVTDEGFDALKGAFGRMIGEVDTWIEEARALQRQMANESDPDAKVDIAHRKQKN